MATHPGNTRRAFLQAAAGTAAATSLAARQATGDAPAQNQVITAVTLIHGIPGREDDLRRHLLSLAPLTRAEAGCVTYDLYESPAAGHEFMRYEIWASPEALEAHKRTPHLRASFEKRQNEGWSTQITVWKRVLE